MAEATTTTGANTTASNTTTTAATTATTPWYDGTGLEQEHIGLLQARGLDKLDAPKAAASLVKSYRELQQKTGYPADRLVVWPDKPENMGPIFEKLGVPKDVNGYDLKDIKFSDGTELDAEFADPFRQEALKLKLTPDATRGMASFIAKYLDGVVASESAQKEAAIIAEREALDKNWGANKAANTVVAQAAIRKFGVDPEVVNALESQVGYAKTMEFFRQVGASIGEDKFVQTDTSHRHVMTREEAASRMADLKNDKLWSERYLAGGIEERNEMTALQKILVAGIQAA